MENEKSYRFDMRVTEFLFYYSGSSTCMSGSTERKLKLTSDLFAGKDSVDLLSSGCEGSECWLRDRVCPEGLGGAELGWYCM